MHDSFVVDQLKNLAGPKRISSDYTFILCPYHSERTPSARVFHSSGFLKCYGCGASKKYNDWAVQAGLEPLGKFGLPKSGEVPATSDRRFIDSLFAADSKTGGNRDLDLVGLDSELSKRLGVYSSWRGFRREFLMRVGAKLAYDRDTYQHFIWLPVIIRGRLKGHILAALKKPSDKSQPSYLNASGTWTRRHGLFPFDYAIEVMTALGSSTIYLVEGPRDALRLLSLGYPAVCILGTHSWTDVKSRNLELSNVERVVVMMDGDDAGKAATQFIVSGMRKDEVVNRPLSEFFKVKVVRLWNLPKEGEENYDPGNLPEPQLLEIVKKTFRSSTFLSRN